MARVKKINDMKRNMAALITGMVITLVIGAIVIIYGFHLGQGTKSKAKDISSQSSQTAQKLSSDGL